MTELSLHDTGTHLKDTALAINIHLYSQINDQICKICSSSSAMITYVFTVPVHVENHFCVENTMPNIYSLLQ